MNALLPRDEALPGLGTAWDAEKMLRVFAASLRTRDGEPVRVRDCKIDRFRYRARTRAIVLYEVAVEPAPPVHLANERGNAWVTAAMYADGRAHAAYRKTRRMIESQRQSITAGDLAPVAYVGELDMYVQIFPVDRYLPALAELAVAVPADLRGAMGTCLGVGDWRLGDVEIRTVRYRPFQGMTLRYDVDAVDRGSSREIHRRFYAKTYRGDEGCQTYDLLGRLAPLWRNDAERLLPPRAAGYFEQTRTLVVEGASGMPVDALLAAGADPMDIGARCADALLRLHRSTIPTRPVFRPSAMLERAAQASEFLAWALPSARAASDEVLAAIAGCAEPTAVCPSHLDLKPDHVFLDGPRATFIDLDTLGLADPALDVAALFARLEALAETVPSAGRAADAFLAAYFGDAPAERRAGFDVAHAYTLLQLALFELRHQRPQWPQRVTALATRAADAVRDRSGPSIRYSGGAR